MFNNKDIGKRVKNTDTEQEGEIIGVNDAGCIIRFDNNSRNWWKNEVMEVIKAAPEEDQ